MKEPSVANKGQREQGKEHLGFHLADVGFYAKTHFKCIHMKTESLGGNVVFSKLLKI